MLIAGQGFRVSEFGVLGFRLLGFRGSRFNQGLGVQGFSGLGCPCAQPNEHQVWISGFRASQTQSPHEIVKKSPGLYGHCQLQFWATWDEGAPPHSSRPQEQPPFSDPGTPSTMDAAGVMGGGGNGGR